MQTVDLNAPRLKVMMDYPGSEFEVGSIIKFDTKTDFYTGTEEWQTEYIKDKKGGGGSMRCIKFFEPYPHIFQPLPWYAEREKKDMPEYVKIVDEDVIAKVNSIVSGVGFDYYETDYFKTEYPRKKVFSNNTIPATIDDYNQYLNNKPINP